VAEPAETIEVQVTVALKIDVEKEDITPVANLDLLDFNMISKVLAVTTTSTCKIAFHDFGGQDVINNNNNHSNVYNKQLY